jgi:hypothetical protein
LYGLLYLFGRLGRGVEKPGELSAPVSWEDDKSAREEGSTHLKDQLYLIRGAVTTDPNTGYRDLWPEASGRVLRTGLL